MHVVLELPGDFPVGRLIDAAAERGVTVYPLDRYFAGKPTMNGLIIGYGTATLPQIRRAAAELADAAQPLSAPKSVSPLPERGRPRAELARSRPTLIVPLSRHTALIQSGASARDHEGFYRGEG